jgi:succinate dehydrogenase hydrophobic anchor subunit
VVNADVQNIQTPYYTYTTNSRNRFIRTSEAYIPTKRITETNGETFGRVKHVFVDKANYLYITDIGNKTVYVLDSNYNYVTKLSDSELVSPISTYVTETTIYVLNRKDKTIYEYDKEALLESNTVVRVKEIGKPTSPIFDNSDGKKAYKYDPNNFVVDTRGNIYIQSIASENGLIMLDPDGRFLTFFGGNPYRIPVVDQIRSLFLTEKQEEKLEQILPDNVTNLAIDSKGFVFTVTSTLPNNPVKKLNVKGTNFFKQDIVGNVGMQSIAIGQYDNVFTLTDKGHIFEYDTNGNLLFMFGGGAQENSNRVGIFSVPVSITTNNNDEIIVADDYDNIVQVFEPTKFVNSVHDAIQSYQDGHYEESLDKWNYVIQYNSLFDYAHIGIGDAYMREYKYHEAFNEYEFAKDYQGLSDAKWGIRQEWLLDNLTILLTIFLVIILLRINYFILNKKYDYSSKLRTLYKTIRSKSQVFDELMFIFEFLKHPFNGLYAIKRQNRVSIKTSTIIFFLLGLVYVLNFVYTDELFVPKDNLNVAYELFIIASVLVLWVVSNYLVCSVSNGEGSIKNVYNATAFALTPYLVIMPIIIMISNFITYQERIFYDLGYTIILAWTIFLIFFTIKDIHNYEVKETIIIIVKSLFTMLIIALCLFIINLLGTQLFTIVKEIITEVVRR